MKEITGDIFTVEADAICVTTNGVIKTNGELVMGAGIAKAFAERFMPLALYLGQKVMAGGNHVHCWNMLGYGTYEGYVVSFPTKEHWKNPSSLALIIQSAHELVSLATEKGWKKVVLPRPGCGLGGLDWESVVKPVLEPILDDRFHIITP